MDNQEIILTPKEALQKVSASSATKAQKLLISSLVTQARSFKYTILQTQESLLILDVTHFLNHRVNSKLITNIGEEMAEFATPLEPDIILTAPSSGNIPAIVTSLHMDHIPDVIYAPKGIPITITDVYQAQSRSYTFGKTVDLTVSKDCLPKGSRVVICDDFLDTGKTVLDLLNIVEQAEAEAVGFIFVIEKPFNGREIIKAAGFLDSQIFSLVKIDTMAEGKLKINGFDSWFELTRK